MWDHTEHEGFEIWVLPIAAFGPRSPHPLFHYSAYICRHGADAHLDGGCVRFHDLMRNYTGEDAALDAAYAQGRRRIDHFRATGRWGDDGGGGSAGSSGSAGDASGGVSGDRPAPAA
jgi:hypothetical protein